MYPQRELTRLALRKAVLRRDIAWRRAGCAQAAGRIARPISWVGGILGPLVKWGPTVLWAGRAVRALWSKK